MTPSAHPTDLELELSRTGEAPYEVEAHVAACSSCAGRRGELAVLADDLRGAAILVPREREEALLERVRERAAELRVRRRAKVGAALLVPAAAAIVAALATALVREQLREPSSEPARAAGARDARDVNGDSTLDVLDAFALARALDRGAATGPDVNGDGAVDGSDVDALARAAVALDGRS